MENKGKIGIIGGGLSGLSLAIGLAQVGVETEIFEKRLSQGSAAGRELPIIMNHRGLKSLQELGVNFMEHEPFLTFKDRHVWFVDNEGQMVMKLGTQSFDPKDYNCFVRRFNLWNILYEEVQKWKQITLHIGKGYESIDYDKGEIRLSDGESKQFEFIFACDGVYSQIRDDFIQMSGFQYLQMYDGWACVALQIEDPDLFDPKAMNLVMFKTSNAQGQIGPHDGSGLMGLVGFMMQDLEKSELSLDDFLRKQLGDHLYSKCSFPDVNKVTMIHDRISIYPWYHKKVMLFGDAANAQGPQAGLGLNVFLAAIADMKEFIPKNGRDWKALAEFITKKYSEETNFAWKIVAQMKTDFDISNREIMKGRGFIFAMLMAKYSDKFLNFTTMLQCTTAPASLIYDVQQKSLEIAGRIMRLEGFQPLLLAPTQSAPIVEILDQYQDVFGLARKYVNERHILNPQGAAQ